MKWPLVVAEKLCAALNHKWTKVPGTPNMFMCSRCLESGWAVGEFHSAPFVASVSKKRFG